MCRAVRTANIKTSHTPVDMGNTISHPFACPFVKTLPRLHVATVTQENANDTNQYKMHNKKAGSLGVLIIRYKLSPAAPTTAPFI